LELSLPEPTTSGLTSGVIREILPNGLTVLVKENHAAPVAAVLVSVKAGYFQEVDRMNGIAHVIEHMLFKGTPRRPADEQIAREVRELGGYINAGTYYEETTYYITVPSQHVVGAMDILADACRNSLFDGDELAKEIEVIVQESLQKRDNPNAMLLESLYALAFDQHRIRRWRIGHPETLRAFRREDLVQFVQDNYRPGSMALTIVGDVNAEQVLAMARELWGDLPRGNEERALSPAEPPRREFRYQRILGETTQRLLLFVLPAPDTLHPDAAPLMVLSGLLSDGRSARLYRRLKEELKLANSAWAGYESFEQMGLFTLGAECIGDDPLPAERALWDEVRRLQHEPIDLQDLERLKTRIETRRLFGQEEVMGMARTLSAYQQLGDYHLADTLVARLRAVTPADVQRVAREYLQVERASLLEYLPAEGSAPPALLAESLQAKLTEDTDTIQGAAPETPAPVVFTRSGVAEPEELALPGNGKLLYKARRDLPIVALNALFRGGKKREGRDIAGITNLLLKSSLKGTLATSALPPLTASEIANRVEGLGTGIGMSAGIEYFGYGIKAKTDVLREAFDVFAAVLARPALPDEEVDREKQAIYADIRRQQDNNYSLANDLFAAACYGDEHPYGLPANGIAEAVAALTPDRLQAWHAAQVRPENLVAAIVGDISAQEAVDLFGSVWENAAVAGRSAPSASVPYEDAPRLILLTSSLDGENERVLYRQKQQTAAMIGFGGADLFNLDRYALDVLNEITSGMGGRLFRAVRGENALAYQVTSAHRSRVDVGNFLAYTSTAPENEQRARDLILAALRELQHEPVTPEELRMAKASIVGEHVINMQTFAAQAGELAVLGVYGLPLDESERYLRQINAVTAEEIRDVARRYLDTERYWLGVVRGGATEPS
jgi:zinc protease